MSLGLKLIGLFLVGFLEMFLATQRTYWISKGRSREAALLVFFENYIAMFIIWQISTEFNGNFLLLTPYAIGNALGTYINLEKVPF